MTALFAESRGIWAIVLMVALPAAVVGAGELEERLRQRDSSLRPMATTLRWWTIPLLAAWAIVRILFEVPSSNIWGRLLATGLLVSLAAAGLSAVKEAVARVRRRGRGDERRQVPQLLLALPRVVVVVVAAWVLLDSIWGVDLSAALTALGVTSLVVSFALQDTLSGLASGMLLLGDSPFRPGDWIRHGELEGRVVDVNWRSTRIENRDGDLLIVPNAELATATVINFDRPTRLHRVVVPVQVAYVNPPTQAKAMLVDAARSTPNVLAEPAPVARVVQIDDPLMGYEVHLWVDDFQYVPQVASDFGSMVWYQSHRHGVPLPSPAYDLYVYDGVATSAALEPDAAEVRRRLRSSALLSQLGEDDLARLVEAATPARFARGETIVGPDATTGDLRVLWTGRARLVARDALGTELEAAGLGPGDLFGLLGRSGRDTESRVVAVTDCEIVTVAATAAGEIISRNPALSEALEQVVAMRKRRIERLVHASDGASTRASAPLDRGTDAVATE